MVTATREAVEGAQIVALQELNRRHFDRFLTHAQIRSDDPLHPTVAPWQPWPYLTARAEAWAAGQSEVVLKARQLGYTWLLAAYLCWRARQGWACAVISKGQEEARAVLSRVRFIEERLPDYLRESGTFNADSAAWPSGGSIRAFPSTNDAGVSYTFQLVAFDEFAMHPFGASNLGSITPTIGAGGQMLIMSTADPALGPSGIFHDMYWASKQGLTGYAAHFEPWYSRPDRDERWLRRMRQAYVGISEEFDAWYPETDTAAFVARSGLVFPQFSQLRHVRASGTPIAGSVRVVAGVDFGGGDPTAIVVLGMDKRQHTHQYAEFYRRGPVGADDLAGFLVRNMPRGGTVVCDPSQTVAIETLKRQTPDTFRVIPADNKRGEGLGMVAFLLDNDRLTIDPTCTDSIAEFPGYRWSTRVDSNDKTRYATTTPVDHHADAMDARRYAVLEITAMLHSGVSLPKRSLAGRPLARRAA
jgi:hypothetical protein